MIRDTFLYSIYRSLGLLISLGLGLAFVSFLLLTNLIHVKRYGAPVCVHTRKIRLGIPYDKAFDICVEAVKSLNCKVKEENRCVGKIVGIKPTKVPLDWLFNQDLITIKLRKVGETTEVDVTSQLYPYTPIKYYVDYGSDFENVEKILKFIKNKIKC